MKKGMSSWRNSKNEIGFMSSSEETSERESDEPVELKNDKKPK
jgi:hypothetical protein